MSYIPTLLHAIETRLDQTTSEITHLQAALAALTTPTSTVTVPPRPTHSSATKQRQRAVTKPARTRVRPRPLPASAPPEPATPITKTPDPDRDLLRKPQPTAADALTPQHAEPIGNGATAAAHTTRQRSSAASAARRKRAPTKLNAETLERLLADAAGTLSASQIAEQAGASYPATLKLLRELEASGQVRRSGERRSTSWRMITDEDRIAERAAELERAAAAPGRRRGRARPS